MEKKESAVRTLGTGDLSLSQLGLAEPATMAASGGNKFPELADSRLRSESAPDNTLSHGEFGSEGTASRPRSLNEASTGDRTPPQLELQSPVQRTPSLRGALKPHRKRGSSVTTNATATAIGAAIAAANHSLGHPSSGAAGPKLTGFAIASKKRNRDFHKQFKSVPDDDYLIEDYSCALQREILAHGRLYVSEGHICFSSNILGWTTTLVLSFDEIVSVEKRSTALLFKNGLMISTLHAKHVFASFTGRDATYDLIVNIWKLGHPTLKSTANGVSLDGTGGDRTEKIDEEEDVGSVSNEDTSDSEEEFYDEEEHDDVAETQVTEVTTAEGETEKASRKVSGMASSGVLSGEGGKDSLATGGAGDFPGPATHAPTDCGDSDSHYDKVTGDDIIAAPLGKVHSLMFGTASPAFMSKWLLNDQKCTDLQMEDKTGLSMDSKSRTYSYIKPLYAAIGPKQTKVISTETLEVVDLEKVVRVIVSTQNPDVPSGNSFTVKTKYCLTWAENNSTHVQINCTTEWSAKSWLKGRAATGKSVTWGEGKC